jgi:hypothetical protein
MVTYLIRRAFQMIIVVLLATLAIYMLLNVAPGGPLAGLKLNADRRTRVSDADIARLEAYLGLDKPLAMRYMVWLIGDDWLGADWMYAGLGPYKQPQLGRNGEPIVKVDRDTGETYQIFDKFRFWADPGVALFNPGYRLWVWGEQVAPGEYSADKIQVKPPTTARAPEDIAHGLRLLVETFPRAAGVGPDHEPAGQHLDPDEHCRVLIPPGRHPDRRILGGTSIQ